MTDPVQEGPAEQVGGSDQRRREVLDEAGQPDREDERHREEDEAAVAEVLALGAEHGEHHAAAGAELPLDFRLCKRPIFRRHYYILISPT